MEKMRGGEKQLNEELGWSNATLMIGSEEKTKCAGVKKARAAVATRIASKSQALLAQDHSPNLRAAPGGKVWKGPKKAPLFCPSNDGGEK